MSEENPANRRHHLRRCCTGGAEIFQNGSRWGWGSVNEISRGGCYIELIHLLPIGTPILLKLSITDLSLEITARWAQPLPAIYQEAEAQHSPGPIPTETSGSLEATATTD